MLQHEKRLPTGPSGEKSVVCTGLHFTFVRKPQLTFDISLKGVMFSEVPGLVGELKRRLLAVIASEAVEPARVYVDMSQPFRNLVTKKQGGQQGQLKVRLFPLRTL